VILTKLTLNHLFFIDREKEKWWL